jgi:hypothetical protein
MPHQEHRRGGDFDQEKLALKHVKFHSGLRKFSYFFNLDGQDRVVISYNFGRDDKVKIVAQETTQGAPLVELIVASDSVRIRTREGEFVLKKGTKVPETTDKRSLLLLAQNWMSGTTAPDHLLNIARELLPPDRELEGTISPIKVNINWGDLWDLFLTNASPQGTTKVALIRPLRGKKKIYIHKCDCGIAMCTVSFLTQSIPVIVKTPSGELLSTKTDVSYSICVCWCMEVSS